MSDDIAEVFADEPQAALEEGDDFDPHISLTISGTTKCPEDKENEYCVYGSNLATVGKTTYSDVYGISIEGADVESYALYIKGSDDGKLTGTQGTEVASVEADNGEALKPGQWGYMLFDDPSSANNNLTSTQVSALTGEDVSIVDSKDDAGTKTDNHNEVDVSRGIAFAANFSEDAPTGHYKSAVTLSLTATPKTAVKFAGVHYMQDMTTDVCKSATPGAMGKLEDKRDGNIYTIGKLEDGNCWMTQNLRIASGTKLTSADSDVSSDYTIPSSTGSDDAGQYYWASSTNDVDYGAYYSWCTATAGCRNASGQTVSSFTSGDAVSSICPKNWKLPPYSGNGSYQTLYGSVTTNRAWTSLNGKNGYYIGGAFFPAAGYGGGFDANSFGYYWSRSAVNSTSSYYLSFFGTGVYPQNSSLSRHYGISVRCVIVADPTVSDIRYMQEMTPEICSKITVGNTQYTLIDRRDGASYTFAKFKDNNCWMTQNLRIVDKTISGADSDLPSGDTFTIPAPDIYGFSAMNDSDGYSAKAYYNNTYGAYYNWFTATAGAGGKTVSSDGTSVTKSICPKGWELPTGGSSGQFQALANTSGVGTARTTWIGSPYNFQYSGYFIAGSLSGTGTSGRGDYWSRTVQSSDNAYSLFIYSGYTDVNPAVNNARYLGLSVRCVAQKTANKSY